MRVKGWQVNAHKTVELIEEELESWQLLVEKLCHVINTYDLLEGLKALLFIPEG